MPRPLELYPTNATDPWNIINRYRGFQTLCHGSSRNIWDIESRPSSNTLVGSTGHLTPRNIVLPIFYIRVVHPPFYVKINGIVAFTISVFVPLLTPIINPSKNYLSISVFPYHIPSPSFVHPFKLQLGASCACLFVGHQQTHMQNIYTRKETTRDPIIQASEVPRYGKMPYPDFLKTCI